MMPVMDGYGALKEIRSMEQSRGTAPSDAVKVFMVTALADMDNVIQAFSGLCDAYLLKPIDRATLLDRMRELVLTG